MLRGFFRALGWVLRRGRRLVLLHVAFVLLLVAAQAIYLLLRLPLSPTGYLGIVLLVLLQQALMLGRAWFQVAFWASEVRVYRAVGSPSWAGPAGW